MRQVLLLCNKFPFPPRDGSSIAMASQIRGLIAAGVKLTVVALNTAKHRVENPLEFSPSEVDWRIFQVDTTPKASTALLNVFSSKSYMVSRFDIDQVHKGLALLLQEKEFDSAIIDGLFMMPYAEQISRAGIPITLRAHNIEHQIWERQIERESSPIKRAYLKLQNSRLYKYEREQSVKADFIVPITGDDAAWFTQLMGKGNVHVMPCGILPEKYPYFGSNAPDVCHIGAMDWMPNVDGITWFAKEVWPKVLQINSQASFHLAGRDSDKLGLHAPQSGFYVEGTVESALDFYSKHGVFVVPLLAGSGMRIKVLEAMAFGKAIVSTSIGVEGIPVDDGVHVKIADSPQAFALAITDLLKDKELRESLGKAARELALRTFDENKLALSLLERMPIKA